MPGFERWQQTWERLRAPVPPVSAFDDLIGRYCEPHRRYHTLQHLDECFEKFAEIEAEAESPGEIELALWFHDAIYDTRRQDNEERSAAWARSVAVGAGMPNLAADRVHMLVLATVHDAVPSAQDERILVDVDLSILAAPPQRFDEYERQIRDEYAWVPEPSFRASRREILEGFLARPRIFGTREFFERYEARARGNLQRSITALAR
jgi:predicted metal-dependent HD superfamily phosphohydrolase